MKTIIITTLVVFCFTFSYSQDKSSVPFSSSGVVEGEKLIFSDGTYINLRDKKSVLRDQNGKKIKRKSFPKQKRTGNLIWKDNRGYWIDAKGKNHPNN